MTHDELVARARRWLLARCPIVITEMVSVSWETPDAIGFGTWKTVLIEAKTSRSDFQKDRQKHFRVNPDNGMGKFRYFMAPWGLIKPEELPEKWGLLEVRGNFIKVTREAVAFDIRSTRCEQVLLTSALRRTAATHVKGLTVKPYKPAEIKKFDKLVEESEDVKDTRSKRDLVRQSRGGKQTDGDPDRLGFSQGFLFPQ